MVLRALRPRKRPPRDGLHELKAKAPHPVDFPTALSLSVRPQDPAYPGAPRVGAFFFWADLFALYVAIPGALIWWALSLLRLVP